MLTRIVSLMKNDISIQNKRLMEMMLFSISCKSPRCLANRVLHPSIFNLLQYHHIGSRKLYWITPEGSGKCLNIILEIAVTPKPSWKGVGDPGGLRTII